MRFLRKPHIEDATGHGFRAERDIRVCLRAGELTPAVRIEFVVRDHLGRAACSIHAHRIQGDGCVTVVRHGDDGGSKRLPPADSVISENRVSTPKR